MSAVADARRVIVALDYANARAAVAMARRLDPLACRVKVGKELFTAAGPAVVDELHALGHDVFLDLKFHDIPNTVAGACRAAAALGVWMVNVHALGGRRMLLAAREAIEMAPARRPLLIAVTVLTSMDDADLADIGIDVPVAEQVSRLALLAEDCALDGVVCSARESAQLAALVQVRRPGFALVTPGIRPVGHHIGHVAGTAADDQRRVVTPAEAIRAGSTFLVIGRPITAAADPNAVLAAINVDIDPVLA